MKKILSLLIITVFLTSCTGNTQDTPTDELPWVTTNELPKVDENQTNVEENTNENEDKDSDEATSEKIEENTETPVEWIPDTEVNTDDEALEAEVNDLLDEFIDSLDSYDK